jgi:hypothetical protein
MSFFLGGGGDGRVEVGGGGGLKYPLPLQNFCKRLPSTHLKFCEEKFLEKNAIFEEIFDFFG